MQSITNAQVYQYLSPNVAKSQITIEILNRIEDDLDLEERLSILFLMVTDYASSFPFIFELFQQAELQNAHIIEKFVKKYSYNWENKLLEAICICNNQKIVRKLGIPFSHLASRFLLNNGLYTENLNFIIKCLYMLCESLTKEQATKLISKVKNDRKIYDSKLDNLDNLELHILYWIHIGYISVSVDLNCNLQNILKYLKEFDDIERVYLNLKACEVQSKDGKKSETAKDSKVSVDKPVTHFENQVMNAHDNASQILIRNVTKGLCIIVNEILFSGKQYETRYGSIADCTRLSRTFKGIGFNVHVVENMKGQALLRKIENIPMEFGTDYDCIFLCILSHGSKDSIIASDEVEISIQQIEKKICCTRLKNVLKIVVIQACQGNKIGQMKDQVLATDGPQDNRVLDIAGYENFAVFMSTMQGCVSIRHKQEGSWFIQEFCNVIEKNDNGTSFLHVVTKVVQGVRSKRGVMDGTYSVAQLPELRPWRMETDFQLPKYVPPNDQIANSTENTHVNR